MGKVYEVISADEHSVHANQTGGRRQTQESLQVRVRGPSDIGLIKPLRGRHQSGAAWREAA